MNLIYLYVLVALESTLLGAELVASQLTHSLIILTDAYHTLYNIISIILLTISFKMSNEKTVKNTFGWARIEVLGMLVNMTFMVALTFSLLVEGIQQLVHASHEISESTNYYLLFAFGVCGLISNLLYFNIVSDAIMSQTKQRTDSLRPQEKIVFNDILSLNIDSPSSSSEVQKDLKDVTEKLLTIPDDRVERVTAIAAEHYSQQNIFYGMFRDLTGSTLLIICGIFVCYSTETVAHLSDPILGMVSAIVFCVTLYPNMRNTGLILLQTVPETIDVGRLKKNILREFPIILNIHDLHIWGLTASRVIATCHIILPKQSSNSFDQFSKQLEQFFQRQGIVLATVQPEFCEPIAEHQNQLLSCFMKCSKFSNTNCDSFTCCANEDNECNESICFNDRTVCEEVVSTNHL